MGVKGQANVQLCLALLVPLGDLRVLFMQTVNCDAMSTDIKEEWNTIFF